MQFHSEFSLKIFTENHINILKPSTVFQKFIFCFQFENFFAFLMWNLGVELVEALEEIREILNGLFTMSKMKKRIAKRFSKSV